MIESGWQSLFSLIDSLLLAKQELLERKDVVAVTNEHDDCAIRDGTHEIVPKVCPRSANVVTIPMEQQRHQWLTRSVKRVGLLLVSRNG
jgi:hypothetical protein